MTKVIRGITNVKPEHQHALIAISDFDGVHLGHQHLLASLKERAQHLSSPTIAVIIEPPFKTCKSNAARLMRWHEKLFIIREHKIDYVLILRMDISQFKFSDQLLKLLEEKLQAKHVLVDDSFSLAFKESPKSSLFELNFISPPFIRRTKVTSQNITKLILEGDFKSAASLLGHPYIISGRIIHGDRLGRKLGFPTANILLQQAISPVNGIYIVRVHGIAKQSLPGVASVGTRPTVHGKHFLLETYLFNFNQDIYGKRVGVEFCKKLRDEKHYDNLDSLKEQIGKDVDDARHFFIQLGELEK